MPDTPIIDDAQPRPVEPVGQLLSPVVSATEPTVPDGGVDGAQSVISTLRTLRSKLGAQAEPLDIVVPGYDDLLYLRCKWVPLAALAASAESLAKIDQPTEQRIAAAADTLIATCQEFRIKVDKEKRALSETPEPITFADPRLPELLGFAPQPDARSTVRAVFANELALINTANAVLEWLQDTSKKLDRSYLGN